jgi:glycoside/pentoside/hexuronide:cation symporter, GPH family
MADIVEYGALQTGRRTEGTFFAATSLINKASTGVGVFLGGQIQGLSGLGPHALPATLDPQIMHRLFLMFVPALILLHAGAIFWFLRYRITRAQHEENVRQLQSAAPAAAPGE